MSLNPIRPASPLLAVNTAPTAQTAHAISSVPLDTFHDAVAPAPGVNAAKAAAVLFQKHGAGEIEKLWSVEGTALGSPAVDKDGRIYAGLTYPECVVSYAPATGEKRWTAKFAPESAPLLTPDEKLLLVSGKDHLLHALDPSSGSQVFTIPAAGRPFVGGDGHIYLASGARLTEIDLDSRSIKQTTELPHGFESAPAVGPDATIYGGGQDGNLYALEPGTAQVKWTRQTGGMLRNSPLVGPDGTVYAGCIGKALVAVDPRDGSEKWRFDTLHWILPEPAVGPDGTVFVGCSDEKVYALDPSSGNPIWTFDAKGEIRVSPVPARDGTVYVVTDRNRFYGVDARNGIERWSMSADSYVHCPPAVDNHGGFVFACNNHKIYAIRGNETARRLDVEAAARTSQESAASGEPPAPAIVAQDGWIVIGSVRVPVKAGGA